MNSSRCWWRMNTSLAVAVTAILAAQAQCSETRFSGDAIQLQETIDKSPSGATIVCDRQQELVISETIRISRPITLSGLRARLPDGLGKTAMIIVAAPDVVLSDIQLHGNYATVTQENRAPMIWLQQGRFDVRNCKFYDGSKDGIMVTPLDGAGDIVGGRIGNIEAFRMARDAVSISGGNKGQRVRDVTVENVSLKRGYLRGPVEVSDGTDNITVRNVYAEDARYAIDVQDHRGDSGANTNVKVENVQAVRCKHLIRTANSSRGHAHLVLRNMIARNCEEPVRISNTADVVVENLIIECQAEANAPPIALNNCQQVQFQNLVLVGLPEGVQPTLQVDCSAVVLNNVSLPLSNSAPSSDFSS